MVYSMRLPQPVTSFYMQIIEKGFAAAGHQVEMIDGQHISGTSEDIYIVGRVQDAAKLWVKRKKRFVLWIQGLWAEESFMRHHNRLRKKCIEFFEYFFMKRAGMIFFVSKEMQNYYEAKYKLSFRNKAIVMPCFNECIDLSSFFEKGKYDRDTFAYIGGLQQWQCFEDIVSLYSFFEKYGDLNEPCLEVYTKNKKEAIEIIEAAGIKNYLVDWVAQEQVKDILRKIKYGFIIRNDIDVNRVSTPTKTVNYLASGVIPIYSDCVKSICGILSQCRYAVPVFLHDKPIDILKRLPSSCNASEICNEYKMIFEKYYNVEYFVGEVCAYARENFS